MGTCRVSEGAVSYSSILSKGTTSTQDKDCGRGVSRLKPGSMSTGIARVTRVMALLAALFLLMDGIGDFRAEAQFGSGRSRSSIFNKSRSRKDDSRQSSQSNQGPSQPSDSGESQPPPAPVAPVQPVAPEGAAPPKLVRPATGKKPATGKPGAKGTKEKEEKTQAGIAPEGHITLFVVPMDLMKNVGDEFPIHVWLDNPDSKPIEVVSFALSFNPQLLEYVDAPGGSGGWPNVYDQSDKIRKAIPLVRNPDVDPFYLNQVDAANGMIYYRARCAVGESSTAQGFIATMKFRALGPVDQTTVRFLFADWPDSMIPAVQSDQDWAWPKEMTFVGGKGSKAKSDKGGWTNLLGSTGSTQDGVVSGNLTLKGDYVKALQEEDESIPKGEAFTRIVLEPRLNSVQVGKTFDLNVKISNPKGTPWDKVRLQIQFDPKYLMVVDSDSGNWVTRGTNILDGPFHDRFPFEWTPNNMVRQQDGQVFYECGVLTSPLRGGGTLATIQFQALRPIPETWVAFHMPSEMGSRDGTVLTRKRLDVLGNTDDPGDGVSGALVSIVPRKPGEAKEEHVQSKSRQK